MKSGMPENHNEYEQYRDHWAAEDKKYPITTEQFRSVVAAVIHSHNDLVKMAMACNTSLSTISRWAAGASNPHPLMMPCFINCIRKAFHEKL